MEKEMAMGLCTLWKVRVAIEKWVSAISPIEQWDCIFKNQFNEACMKEIRRLMQEEVDEFLGNVETHINIGRGILHELCSSLIIRPPPSHEGWADFLIAGDMLETL
jgi:hypothetical protein